MRQQNRTPFEKERERNPSHKKREGGNRTVIGELPCNLLGRNVDVSSAWTLEASIFCCWEWLGTKCLAMWMTFPVMLDAQKAASLITSQDATHWTCPSLLYLSLALSLPRFSSLEGLRKYLKHRLVLYALHLRPARNSFLLFFSSPFTDQKVNEPACIISPSPSWNGRGVLPFPLKSSSLAFLRSISWTKATTFVILSGW